MLDTPNFSEGARQAQPWVCYSSVRKPPLASPALLHRSCRVAPTTVSPDRPLRPGLQRVTASPRRACRFWCQDREGLGGRVRPVLTSSRRVGAPAAIGLGGHGRAPAAGHGGVPGMGVPGLPPGPVTRAARWVSQTRWGTQLWRLLCSILATHRLSI